MATRVVTTPLNVRPPLRERAYLFEVMKGLGITITHFLKNIADLRKNKVGITYQWPEELTPLPDNLRGEHRLMHRPDGTPRCVACNCCATACPANCIEITGGDTGHDGVEKFPVRFDIDILQCVYCGLCVEACPCDAIRMDTGIITAAYYEGPVKILDIDYLMKNHPEGKSPISEAIY
jgi:NADH-quinone oxidoreductase subunit I